MVDMNELTAESEAKKADELQVLTDQFLINKDEAETKLTLDFAKALLALDIDIKDLKTEQKAIKKNAKAEGVSVQKVTKALTDLKAIAKANDMDLLELETIEEVLGADVDVKTMISELIRKD